ncbi:hypothetical protein H0H93_005266 [Arthromyces matolae]|nr:hypothetical protein H0H93_005266 [Arthromyces matolae]
MHLPYSDRQNMVIEREFAWKVGRILDLNDPGTKQELISKHNSGKTDKAPTHLSKPSLVKGIYPSTEIDPNEAERNLKGARDIYNEYLGKLKNQVALKHHGAAHEPNHHIQNSSTNLRVMEDWLSLAVNEGKQLDAIEMKLEITLDDAEAVRHLEQLIKHWKTRLEEMKKQV